MANYFFLRNPAKLPRTRIGFTKKKEAPTHRDSCYGDYASETKTKDESCIYKNVYIYLLRSTNVHVFFLYTFVLAGWSYKFVIMKKKKLWMDFTGGSHELENSELCQRGNFDWRHDNDVYGNVWHVSVKRFWVICVYI